MKMIIINALRTNDMKGKVNTQKKCRLYNDRDERVYQLSGCNKLAQKEYKNRHSWTGEVDLLKILQEIII